MFHEECISNGALLSKKILQFTIVNKPISDKEKLMREISTGNVGKKTSTKEVPYKKK